MTPWLGALTGALWCLQTFNCLHLGPGVGRPRGQYVPIVLSGVNSNKFSEIKYPFFFFFFFFCPSFRKFSIQGNFLPRRPHHPPPPPPKKKERKQVGQAIKTFLKSRSHTKKTWPGRCSKFYAYCLLSCRDISTLIFCLCRPTVTLHQGHGHRHEYEQICVMHESTVMPRLTSRAMAIIVHFQTRSLRGWELFTYDLQKWHWSN